MKIRNLHFAIIFLITFSFLLVNYKAKAQVSFSSTTNFAIEFGSFSVFCDDFNGDAKADLVISNNSSDTLSVLLGNGDGTFGIAYRFAAGPQPTSFAANYDAVTCEDFNGDNISDLAVTNYVSNKVSVLLGKGDGTFGAATGFSVGTHPGAVLSADFNRDGKMDLAVVNANSNNVSILLGNGSGSFGLATNFTVGNLPYGVCSFDLNKDSKIDLVIVNQFSDNVSVLLGDGTGGFSTNTNFTVGSQPQLATIADFNADNKTDIAVVNISSNNVSLLLGDGTGGFNPAVNYAVGNLPNSLISSDFNGDCNADLAVTNSGDNSVSILLGDGAGVFSIGTNFGVGVQPVSILSPDLNGDNKPDLVVVNQGSSFISILLNTSSFPVSTSVDIGIIASATTLCTGGSVTLTATGSSSYIWSNGLINSSITVSDPGIYWVEANAGCSGNVRDSISISMVNCEEEYTVTSNVFTPNNDGLNDIFKIVIPNVTTLNCKIYNRWGILVKELTEINEGWDGNTTGGLQCAAGVYYWIAEYKDATGSNEIKKGFVQLIR